MIQLLANKYQKTIAFILFTLFYQSFTFNAFACYSAKLNNYLGSYSRHLVNNSSKYKPSIVTPQFCFTNRPNLTPVANVSNYHSIVSTKTQRAEKADIGGPNQPEMSSFKSVGTDNMVNLFTGDFNYNIPLLDVGGYPVNLFYNGGISAEQEAGWVGLGWNINPGNINRNMRGVPDDFDGTDTLVQAQRMKKNKTWGIELGADIELTGIKGALSLGAGSSLGMSFNNYLGPALDISSRRSIGFTLASKSGSEKCNIGAGLSINVNSRSGMTFSPNVSLTGSASQKHSSTSFGIGLSTSYNSRSGIKAIQISEQASFNSTEATKSGLQSKGSISHTLFSNTISFAKPSYIPAIRMPLTNSALSGHIQTGGGIFGVAVDVEYELYRQTSEVAPNDVVQRKPMVGYIYYQNAVNNANAILDFTRFNDKEVLPSTPIISVPQYCYDVFSIQGEGTGGSIRAYRNDIGYVRDSRTQSKDISNAFGFDVDIPGHFGGNYNSINTPSTIGEWVSGNKLKSAANFTVAKGSYENVYFRNPGESSVLLPGQYDAIGGTDLVRFTLSGNGSNPVIEPTLQRFDSLGHATSITPLKNTDTTRKKRSQVISFLTANQASIVGLDKTIKSYNSYNILDNYNNLSYQSFTRNAGYRKGHHISQINVTEADGKRYIYGVPVYNVIQKDFTFSVDNTSLTNAINDKVQIDSNWMKASSSPLLNDDSHKDGYVEETRTPAYAHSFLLSGLLSPDYVDLNGDGITDDDLGNAVKFNYTRIKKGNDWALHKWRTPLTKGDSANFNPGNRSELKDDKGLVSYGERESWYVHSIESKTMIAIFRLGNREDGKGPKDANGGIDETDSSQKKLNRIDLYNKADLKANGLAKAKPIKSVIFKYSYSLCNGTPDNTNGGGKLTLDSIYFSFNGQERSNKNKYVFSYTDSLGQGNPDYISAASDRWGTFKPDTLNPSGIKNSLFPYSLQDATKKSTIDQNAEAWSLKRILLPSGGQLSVQYESDDYAYVQNLRATDMMQVVGFGYDSLKANMSDRLYTPSGNPLLNAHPYTYIIANNLFSSGGMADCDYIFIKVPRPCNTNSDVYKQYLLGVGQVSIKYAVNMPKGIEYLTTYATVNSYGITSDPNTIWIKVNEVDGESPMVLTALEYLREQLPGQAFTGYDVSESAGLAQIGQMLAGMLDAMRSAFTNPIKFFKGDGKASTVKTAQSFVRLNDPDGFKFGGGHRVKSIILKDNWDKMTGQYNSTYGQTYDYTTTENFNGKDRIISSGVASYEPTIGGEENPFQTMVQVSDKIPLGPTSYGAIEMPVLDAFFPAPSVGYSKVTVRSLQSIGYNAATHKSRSGIGKQVSEFFTAKDYPVRYSNTSLDPQSDLQSHAASTLSFFNKYQYDYRALSQGFQVQTNDMHGKLKSQSSYPDNDTSSPISFTQNYYSNTGNNGLSQKYQFVQASQGGQVISGNMGIDIELMTDAREFSVKSNSREIQAQLDLFPVIWPWWLPTIWPVTGNSENTYRAVTTTKVITYHSMLDSVVVIDKGSQVSTKNLIYDAETGNVVVNRTNNEFDQPFYSTTYPAYWAYSGMGLAYKNIGATFKNVTFSDGRLISGADATLFESGDELLVLGASNTATDCHPVTPEVTRLWAYDTAKNSSPLTDPNKVNNMLFMDSAGNLYTNSRVNLMIVRSGHRNMLDAPAATVTSMKCPIAIINGITKLKTDSTFNVINSSASEYREKWQMDQGILKKFTRVYDQSTCSSYLVEDCNGNYEKHTNPYCKGLMGNFKPYQSMVFYSNRKETSPVIPTNLPQNGYLGGFQPYWDFNTGNNLVPDANNSKWVWNSQLTRINAKGQELETKNALGIYTCAQYGYDKGLPVAITQNTPFSNSIYEGFEDSKYNANLENLNATKPCIPYINWGDANIVLTDSLGFNAHTGKHVLKIAPGINNTISVVTGPGQIRYDDRLVFGRDTTTNFTERGVNIDHFAQNVTLDDEIIVCTSNRNSNNVEQTLLDTNHVSITTPSPSGGDSFYSCVVKYGNTDESGYYERKYNEGLTFSGFFVMPKIGKYNIKFVVNPYHNCVGGGDDLRGSNLYLSTFDGIPVFKVVNQQNHFRCGNAENVIFDIDTCLNPGVYKITLSTYSSPKDEYGYETVAGELNTSQITSPTYYNSNTFQILSTYSLYESLDKVGGCSYAVPVSNSDSMLNPVFNIQSQRKMLFSAWVRESCSTSLCTKTSYDSNKVQFKYKDSAGNVISGRTLKPSGGIIDGWQRYEGYFTTPTDATNVEMQLQNSSTTPIYFDDIRIQPYNSDMKSYVYDPINLRLVAELDANNYATFYEYDEEGTLVRTKVETKQGIKTVKETRSAKQKKINTVD